MQRAKALKILGILQGLYPNPASELNFINNYQLLIAVILSAQCTDKKVNQVTQQLFDKYPDFKALAGADLTSVEAIIRAVNYYKTKSRNIIATAKTITQEHAGELPLNHKILTTLPGVGNKTANVVLGELKVQPTFPVDTHVFRVSKRLGFSNGKNVLLVEKDLKKLFPENLWRTGHHILILHGRRLCKAARPLCAECPLNKLCPASLIN